MAGQKGGSDFEQPDSVASDWDTWEHWTKARMQPNPYEPGMEVDETHQYDKPIGGAMPPSSGTPAGGKLDKPAR